MTTSGATPVYPTELEAHVALRDGSIVHVRPIRPADESRLLAFLLSLPDEDRRTRFFSLSTNLAGTAHQEADVDYTKSLGLLVTRGSEERIVGHALYAASGADSAEVAFAIAPQYQAHGLATMLLGQLAQAAASHGIETFEAFVLPENRRMLAVFRQAGFPLKTVYAGDTVELSFPTSLSPEALGRFELREERTAASAIHGMLYPRSVAVIGASRRSDAAGAAVLRNLLAGGFRGPIYPVNPAAETIQTVRAYASISEIPQAIDLAIVAVAADSVVGVAAECGRKGVHGLIVLAAGFGEIGQAGQQLEAELLGVCRTYGMRLVGPNCIGVVNSDPSSPMNATVGSRMPRAGSLGLATQSGALGLAAIDFMSARGLGMSSMVSMGNKADISGNDVLGYWHTDPRTEVMLLYLESFGNPRKFARLARSIALTKPIVALKSGRMTVGERASASHTGALLAASDLTVDALFRQAGVVRVDTLNELLDVADLLAHQPLPRGRRVAIVSNVTGPAKLCADTCEVRGLEVASLSQTTRLRLREILAPEASVANPVDMVAATPQQYRQAVRIVAEDSAVDAVIVIVLPFLATDADDVAASLNAAVEDLHSADAKPVAAVFMSAAPPPPALYSAGRRIPGYQMPEPAAIALAHAVEYAAWRAQPAETPPNLEVQRDATGLLLADAVRGGSGWLDPDAVRRLLSLYGVPLAERSTAPAGVEMLVGVVNDPLFGPTIACGPGGTLVELLKDVAVRLTPLTRGDAASMLRELRSFPLLNGYGGAAACAVGALEDLLLRVGALAEDHPRIAEMDCTPVIVTESGAVVVDARVRVAEPLPRRPLGARR